MKGKIITGFVILALGVAIGFYLYKRYLKKDKFTPVISSVETAPEVEYIQGDKDQHMVDADTGVELIPSGDLALGNGFGANTGTLGFGRAATTLSA